MSDRRTSFPSSEFTFAVPSIGGTVDKANAVVRGVSMITGNVTAKGHDLEVDDTTLKQIFECATKMVKVPVKLNHGSGIEAVNGYLSGFKRDGNKVRADWHLLNSHPQTPQMLEIAERQPETVGLSVTFRGDPEVKSGKKHARCRELVTTDIVPHPAANPEGMFSEMECAELSTITTKLSAGEELTNAEKILMKHALLTAFNVDNARSHMPATAPAAAAAAPAAETNQDPLAQILAKLNGLEETLGGRLDAIEAFLDQEFGGEAPGGEEPGGGEGAEMQTGAHADPLVAFEARARKIVDNIFAEKQAEITELEEQAATEQGFAALNEKHAKLVSALEAKTAEVIALHDLNKQLRNAGAMAPVQGAGGDTTMFNSHVPKTQLTQFESIVRDEMTKLSAADPNLPITKVRTAAITKVINEQPAVYDAYLKRNGADNSAASL